MKLFNSDRTSETRGERERRGKGQRAGRDGWRVSGELWRIWAISTGACFGAFNLGRFTGVCGGFWTIVDKSHERRENRLVGANKRLKIGVAVRACLGKADYPTISAVKAKKNRQRARPLGGCAYSNNNIISVRNGGKTASKAKTAAE